MCIDKGIKVFLDFVHYGDGFKTSYSMHLFNAKNSELSVISNKIIPNFLTDAKRYLIAQKPPADKKLLKILDGIKCQMDSVHCFVTGKKILDCNQCILSASISSADNLLENHEEYID